jgi:hypothetical protein
LYPTGTAAHASGSIICMAFEQSLIALTSITEYDTDGIVLSSPAITRDSTVYVGSGCNIVALDSIRRQEPGILDVHGGLVSLTWTK